MFQFYHKKPPRLVSSIIHYVVVTNITRLSLLETPGYNAFCLANSPEILIPLSINLFQSIICSKKIIPDEFFSNFA